MKQRHSTAWKASVQPRKQRKFRHNAPEHLRGAFLHVHLSKELREKHQVRALRVRKGDKVKVLRGTHKGKEGKVESVETRRSRIFVAKVETQRLQGGAARYALQPSNCMITELIPDKRRFKEQDSKQPKKAAPKNETKEAKKDGK